MTMPETARNMYDTHAAIRRLTEAGLPEPHAEAMVAEQVHLMEHNLATKADIAAVQGDIEKLRLETKVEITAVQATLQADIEKLRLETRADIAKVQGNIEAAKAELVKWMVGTNIGVVALIVAALKLL